jgi:Flp pilus assembly protein protease CpaA
VTHISIAVAALVLTVAGTDFGRRRVPNWLTLGGASGISASHRYRWKGGARTGRGRHVGGRWGPLCLVLLHAMGAGDLKLMCPVGAFLGPSGWMAVFMATAIAAGAAALVLMVSKGRFGRPVEGRSYLRRAGALSAALPWAKYFGRKASRRTHHAPRNRDRREPCFLFLAARIS